MGTHTRHRFALALAVSLAAATAHASQTTNNVLRAVPVPGDAVEVDGVLDDWDLSGQFEVYANHRMKHNYSVKVAGMYDAENLYLALVWRDPTPLYNMIDARFDIGSGWRGDCLQLRLITDMVIGAVDCWYSTAGQKSVINITYGSFDKRDSRKTTDHSSRFHNVNDALRLGARQAFKKGEDGKSYTQEIALPWKLVTAQAAKIKETGRPHKPPRAYAAGDEIRMGMEFLWGGPDGKTWPIHRYADLLKEGHTDREFFWTAERAWGTVRLEPAGNLPPVASPAAAAEDLYNQTTHGPVEFDYVMPFDGFATIVIEDASGKRVRNLIGMAPRKAGRVLECWDGADDDGKAVPPGRYRWHGLVHQGIDPTYEATYGSPGRPAWGTADGTGDWLSDHNANVAVAAGRNMVVLAASGSEAGWAMIGTDLTGKRKWGFRKFASIRDLAASDTYLYAAMNPASWHGVSHPSLGRITLDKGAYAPFKTAKGEALSVALTSKGEEASIAGLTIVDGRLAVGLSGLDVVRFYDADSMEKLGELKADGVRDLATDTAGKLLVLTKEMILRRNGATLAPVARSHLGDAHSLAVARDGTMYVTDRATHQVKVLSAQGAFVRAIGTKGGRPLPGKWDPNGLLQPAGLDVDAKGRIWVAEETKFPKRISVWNADGSLAMDFIGPTTYGGMGAVVDPEDKHRVFGNGCEYRLDYDKNEQTVVANVMNDNVVGEMLRRGGREYVMAKRGKLYLRKGDALVLVASFGSGRVHDKYVKPRLERLGVYEEADKLGGTCGWMWCDANDDATPQRDEVFIKDDFPMGLAYWGGYWIDEDWNAYCVTRDGKRGALGRIPLVRFTEGGVPVWDPRKMRFVGREPIQYPSMMYLASRDAVVIGSGSRMVGLDPDGSPRWTYRDRYNGVHGSHRAPIPERDDFLVGTLSCIGRADSPVGPVFATNSNMGRLYVFTTDGLFAAGVFQDCRTGPEAWPASAKRGSPMGGVTMGGEWFGGYFFKAAGDHAWYLIAGSTSYNLIKLNGLEAMRRLVGWRFDLTKRDLLEAQRMQAERAAKAAASKKLTITRLASAPVIDAVLTEYPDASFVKWGAGEYALRAAVAVHGDDLHLAYRIDNDRNPMVNKGKDWTQLFVTGDSVDLKLGTDPGAKPDRRAPVAGDLRLLISEMDRKPVAVLYRWKSGATDRNTVTFTCPWRNHTVDDVRTLERAEIRIARKGRTYVVEARVPLSDLGFSPEAGMAYKLDLGAVFSDATGTNRQARVYWANKATGLVNDVPGEIMASPRMWGSAVLGE